MQQLDQGGTMTVRRRELRQMAPPWRDRLPTGELGDEYGPSSPVAYARHLAKYRDWSFRMPSKDSMRCAEAVIAFMRLDVAVPPGEKRAFELVYERGHSVRFAARMLGVTRETVQSALRRLRAKVHRDGRVTCGPCLEGFVSDRRA